MKPRGHHCSRLRLRSSGGPSSSRSAVSVGFSRECTLLAMLDLRVPGADESCRGIRGPLLAQLLSMLTAGGGATSGCIGCCRLDPLNSYCANMSRTCWSLDVAMGMGDDHGPEELLAAVSGKGETPCGGHPCCRMSANVWRRAATTFGAFGGDVADERGCIVGGCVGGCAGGCARYPGDAVPGPIDP